MIYIKRNTINKFPLTLTESSTLVDPFYLFEFTNEFNATAKSIYFIADDESLSPNRYNLFTLEESDGGSVTGGDSIALKLLSGQYEYRVYESTTRTLDKALTTGVVVEVGRMVVDHLNWEFDRDEDVIPEQNNTENIYD